MRNHRFQICLLMISLMCFNLVLLQYMEEKIQKQSEFSFETGMKHFVNFNVSTREIDTFYNAAKGDLPQFLSLLTVYLGTDCKNAEITYLLKETETVSIKYTAEFESLYQYLAAVIYDMKCFPVGNITNFPDAGYSYIDSWQFERTYGGERAHEGCDIMADLNQRGIYPVLSATDGVIENLGWLNLGGWRIGIRSSSGAYYYYAHLSEYAGDFTVGESVEAGTLLGFMGDTGYGEIPGTYGKFPVHLHFGIYFEDEFGREYAINPYPALYFCELQKKGAPLQK